MPQLLQPGENRWDLPAAAANEDTAIRRQDARDIVDNAAAGDVGHAADDSLFHRIMSEDALHGFDVDPRWSQQFLAHRLA